LQRSEERAMAEEKLPEAAELIKDFVNTYDLFKESDELGTTTAMVDWFAARGLMSPGAPLDDAGAAQVREVREALRQLLLGHNDGPVSAEAVAVLNRAAESSQLCIKFTPEGSVLACTSSGADAALSRVIASVHLAMTDDTWSRLKACRRDDCQWVFYDQSRNQSKTWCSMGVCGNRTKAETFRKRHAHSA
jgi:predicted RNA-binding Zn ribbon-like protein